MCFCVEPHVGWIISVPVSASARGWQRGVWVLLGNQSQNYHVCGVKVKNTSEESIDMFS